MSPGAASRVYRTEPQEIREQPFFANQVVELFVDPAWDPNTLLAAFKRLEQALGREAGVRFGPRVIDIDLLLFGDLRITSDEIVVPHPRMDERAFVLVPLADLAPELDVPGQGRVDRLLARLDCSIEDDIIRQGGEHKPSG